MQICSADADTNLFIPLLLLNLISTDAINQKLITSSTIFLRVALYYILTYFFIVTSSVILQKL